MAITARTLRESSKLPGSLTETAELIRAAGGTAVCIVAALEDAEARAGIAAEAQDKLGGPIDILVNNAAAAVYQPSREYPLKRRRMAFEVNFHAPLDLAQAVIPGMIERGGGWIVNLSSGTARLREVQPRTDGSTGLDDSIFGTGIYGASKAALDRLTNILAAELNGTGVRVNAIRPRSGVLTDGAIRVAGDLVGTSHFLPESLEAMVEATLMLCDCSPDWTGRIEVSLDILERLSIIPRGLDGSVRARVDEYSAQR